MKNINLLMIIEEVLNRHEEGNSLPGIETIFKCKTSEGEIFEAGNFNLVYHVVLKWEIYNVCFCDYIIVHWRNKIISSTLMSKHNMFQWFNCTIFSDSISHLQSDITLENHHSCYAYQLSTSLLLSHLSSHLSSKVPKSTQDLLVPEQLYFSILLYNA